MPYIKRDIWAPSQRPYAIDRASAKKNGHRLTVRALWAGRKRQQTTITLGELSLWAPGRVFATVDAALADADTRYGGDWHALWDGTNILIEPRHPLGPDAAVVLAATLDGVLKAVPEVPDGWDGWYYRASRTP